MRLTALPRALLFDLDGTLAHTIPQLAKAGRRAAEAIGVEAPDPETTRSYVGNGVQLLLSRIILKSYDVSTDMVDPGLLSRARAAFNTFYLEGLDQDYEIYPGVTETLGYARSRGIRLAVVTNKPQMFADPLLGYMGLRPYFDLIVGGEVLERRKPDPCPLSHALARLGVEAAAAVMVGDSPNDVIPARALGLTAVFFTFGYCRGSIDPYEPDYKFDSWHGLLELLRSLEPAPL